MAGPGRRRWRLALMVGGVLFVAGATVPFARYALRAQPGPRAIEAAVRAFRRLPMWPAPTGARYHFPAAGVYEVAGQGAEHISFPPNTQRDAALMPATVSYDTGGCWVWHLDYNAAHSEEYRFCPRGDELVLAGDSNTQTWDFGVAKVKNIAHFTCDAPAVELPADPASSPTLVRKCDGTSSAIAGQTTTTTSTRIVGVEQLAIEGSMRSAVHQVQQTTVTGGQSGTVTQDWWQATTTGLPLRTERHIRLDTGSPLGGTITYTEDGSWQLRSLQPRS